MLSFPSIVFIVAVQDHIFSLFDTFSLEKSILCIFSASRFDSLLLPSVDTLSITKLESDTERERDHVFAGSIQCRVNTHYSLTVRLKRSPVRVCVSVSVSVCKSARIVVVLFLLLVSKKSL